jgi:hypothetical protein
MLGKRGRSHISRAGIGGATVTAFLQCSTCPKKGEVSMRVVMPPEHVDKKFIQRGWQVDPHLCPDCRRKPKDKPMPAAQSVAAMRATIQMHDLLTAHFDSKNGRYVAGWSDEKVAKETGLAMPSVAEYRIAEFGEIKEPTELALIRADITSLEQLDREHRASVAAEVASLRTRLADVAKKMGLAA